MIGLVPCARLSSKLKPVTAWQPGAQCEITMGNRSFEHLLDVLVMAGRHLETREDVLSVLHQSCIQLLDFWCVVLGLRLRLAGCDRLR